MSIASCGIASDRVSASTTPTLVLIAGPYRSSSSTGYRRLSGAKRLTWQHHWHSEEHRADLVRGFAVAACGPMRRGNTRLLPTSRVEGSVTLLPHAALQCNRGGGSWVFDPPRKPCSATLVTGLKGPIPSIVSIESIERLTFNIRSECRATERREIPKLTPYTRVSDEGPEGRQLG